MCLNLNLNLHPERQRLHPHTRQHRLMIRTVLPQIAYEMLHPLGIQRRRIAAHLVDLRPALPTCLLQGVLDVREGLVDLRA
jgi:hypothetical protein